ncbi:MAG: hydrogenase nickel incorporation protein HypB [Dehalococcoidia bacterium]
MKRIEVIQNIMEANETIAGRNQQLLDRHRVFAINIMSSPGGGKTSLILQTMARLKGRLKVGVIEGDVASTVDAEKVQGEARAVVQINTRNMPESCSLMAAMIEPALNAMPLNDMDLVLIENVGNLICPSEFILGEHKRVVISSLPEGDDKPTKYPLIFVDADAVIINKMDLLPYLDFDIAAFRRSISGLNPEAEIFQVSCKTGEGMEGWCSWVLEQVGSHATEQ